MALRDVLLGLAAVGLLAGGLVFASQWAGRRRVPPAAPVPSEPLLVVTSESAPPPIPMVSAMIVTEPSTEPAPPPEPYVAPGPPDAASSTAEHAHDFDEAMRSTDPSVRRAAIAAAMERGDVSALDRIEAVDITQNGDEAAAAMMAVGRLATLAPPPERLRAVRKLDDWLNQEVRRRVPESAGNLSLAVDALTMTKTPEAMSALQRALDSRQLPLPVETRIVQSLGTLDGRTTAPAIERFMQRVQALGTQEGQDPALASEALDAGAAVLAKWR